jgi:RNA-splicing ligase RtcB
MILQRGKPVPVFGTATPGEKVAVKFHGQALTTAADAHGAWLLNLAAMNAAANYAWANRQVLTYHVREAFEEVLGGKVRVIRERVEATNIGEMVGFSAKGR